MSPAIGPSPPVAAAPDAQTSSHEAPVRRADLIRAALHEVGQISFGLPFVYLLTEERQVYGGHLFPCGPAVVGQVAATLSEHPELYEDILSDRSHETSDHSQRACHVSSETSDP